MLVVVHATIFLSLLFAIQRIRFATAALQNVKTVKNLRPVVPGYIYRAASLDGLSVSDAQSLLDGSAFGGGTPLAAVIDLRNEDEIIKQKAKRNDGSKLFYSSLSEVDEGNNVGRLIHIPILGDIDAFWDEAIERMDPGTRISATLQTAFNGGALDRAAARNLEKGGLAMLYTVMMSTARRPIRSALDACLRESARGPIIIHCQKGKDRTGVLSMLLQTCVGEPDVNIIREYSLSGDLLGGEDAAATRGVSRPETSSGSGMVDWSHFRGSPPSAMEDTLKWVNQRYGSVENYMDVISFDFEQRKCLSDRFQNARL